MEIFEASRIIYIICMFCNIQLDWRDLQHKFFCKIQSSNIVREFKEEINTSTSLRSRFSWSASIILKKWWEVTLPQVSQLSPRPQESGFLNYPRMLLYKHFRSNDFWEECWNTDIPSFLLSPLERWLGSLNPFPPWMR